MAAWEAAKSVLKDALKSVERLEESQAGPDGFPQSSRGLEESRAGFPQSSRSLPSPQDTRVRAPTGCRSQSAYEEHRALFNYSPSRSVRVSGKRMRRGRPLPQKKTAWVKEAECLPYKHQEKPLKTEERIQLVRVGLGPKNLSFDYDGDAHHVHSVILDSYPELERCGGYSLLRVGSGSNQLVNIKPKKGMVVDVAYLRAILKSAKLYIRPLQKDLDLTSVERDNSRCELGGPGEVCLRCNSYFTLNDLQDHVEICDPSDNEVEQPVFDSPARGRDQLRNTRDTGGGSVLVDLTSVSPSSLSSDSDVLPPLRRYHEETNVSEMGQSSTVGSSRAGSSTAVSSETCQVLRDAVQTFRSNIGVEGDLSLDIRRQFILHDALMEARKQSFSPDKAITIKFVGEAGVDVGGLRRDFFRLFAEEVAKTYFTSNGFMINNITAVQNRDLYFVGVYGVLSILHGGCGFPFLAQPVYQYLVSGLCRAGTLSVLDVPEPLRSVIQKLDDAKSDDDIRAVFAGEQADLLLVTGFRKPVCTLTTEDRAVLSTALLDYHLMVKVKMEMDEFREGLQTLGTLDMIKENPSLWAPYFRHGPVNSLSPESIKSLFSVEYTGAGRRFEEERAYEFFGEFLDDCHKGGACTLQDVLVFVSGASAIPPTGLDFMPHLSFHDVSPVPTANVCALSLFLPIQHETYKSFKDAMLLAIFGHDGFAVHSIIRQASVAIADPNFDLMEFENAYPAQVGILGIQLIWTRDAEIALNQARTDKKIMAATNQFFLDMLNSLIGMTTQELKKLDRVKYETRVDPPPSA